MSITIEQLTVTRREILVAIKRDRAKTAAELAAELGMSSEAVRQHLLQLEKEKWIERTSSKPSEQVGRPACRYRLTVEGEHLFPKHYDAFAVEMLDTVADQLGEAALQRVLGAMTDARVRTWEARLDGLDLEGRVEALKGIYMDGDANMEVESGPDGLALVERSCPLLNVAGRRPLVCSVTVSTLTRLLGVRVVREERFQNGDGRCVFRIHADQPVDKDTFGFQIEPPSNH